MESLGFGRITLLILMMSPCNKSTVIQRSSKQPTRRLQHEETIKWTNDELTPELRAFREKWELHQMRYMEKVCSTFSLHTPCACVITLTNAKIAKDGVEFLLEYPEYECNEQENRKRFAISFFFRDAYFF